MGSNDSSTPPLANDKTWLAIILCILMVIPSILPAAVVVWLYKAMLSGYVSGHWIPYLEEISLLYFPEMVRGAIVGVISILVTTKLVKSANFLIVRYSTMAFWSGVIILISIMNISMFGPCLSG